MLTWLQLAGLFLVTATAEIFGCYAVYLWLRGQQTRWWLVPGACSLSLFAWLLTLPASESAGRTYAAYGGVYVVTAMLWQWLGEGQVPDRWDLLGALLCLAGMAVLMQGPGRS